MKKCTAVKFLCGLIILGFVTCAVPIGDDFSIPRLNRDNSTFVADYDLQRFVPIPVAGEKVVKSIDYRGDFTASIAWSDIDGGTVGDVFANAMEYQAVMTMTPRAGYEFDPSMSFTYHGDWVQSQTEAKGGASRTITVTYLNTDDHASIDHFDLSYIPIPTVGGTPPLTYTTPTYFPYSIDSISWDPPDESFQAGTKYDAAVALRVKPSFIYDQDAVEDTFRHGNAENITFDADTETVTLSFAMLRGDPTNSPSIPTIHYVDLTEHITKPADGDSPVTDGFETAEYTCAEVSWAPAGNFEDGLFVADKSYTATVVLEAINGYSFADSVGLKYDNASVKKTNSTRNSITVTVTFSNESVKVGVIVEM
jgi:hypothetical protein